MLAFLPASALAQTGPAILIIFKTNGREFVPFSNLARCEAAARMLRQRDEKAAMSNAEKGYTLVAGTSPVYQCIPG